MTDASNIQTIKVLSKTTDSLFSFTTTRPQGFKFTAGQFVRLGVNPSQLRHYQSSNTDGTDDDKHSLDEEIFRAYSIVSSPYEDELEFFSVVIPDGAFTSQLQFLQVEDELLLNTTPFGFLTLARYQLPPPKDLWLLATGTGVAHCDPCFKTYNQNYERIILAYMCEPKVSLLTQNG